MLSALLLACAPVAQGTIHYVNLNNLNPVAPYTDWSTAAISIQDAIDVSTEGDDVIVTNGIYAEGGRVVSGILTNRVVVDKAISVRSVNGPEVTVIEGKSPLGTNAVRCAYLADEAVLSGFTLTNGATLSGFSTNLPQVGGGGAWCESTNALLDNCIVVSNSCSMWGAGVFSGTLKNCQVNSNWNFNGSLAGGGGVAFSAVFDSTLTKNHASINGGGGAISSTLSNCIVSLNTSDGVVDCTLYDCEVTANNGSGMIRGMAFHSLISSNISFDQNLGGGATSATLSNCFVFDNSARNGGGAYNCVLNFCTVSNNYATNSGGGTFWGGIPEPKIDSPGEGNVIIRNLTGGSGGGGYSKIAFGITNWTFISNSAAGDGGGFNGSFSVAKGSISNCVFTANVSGHTGGGIVSYPAMVSVIDCVISSNSAVKGGGGSEGVALQRCLLVRNTATVGGGASGGTAVNSTFRHNSARMGGGGYFSNFAKPANCIFEQNSAVFGGGLYIETGTVKDCQFIENSAETNGGGIFSSSSTTFVTNCVLADNHAGFGAGGYNGVFAGCTIRGNVATNEGGGIYLFTYSQPGTSSNNLVFHNSALGNGGGVVNGTWINCAISNNSAGGNGGGAIGVSLDHCRLLNNTATTNGGGGCFVKLSNSLVTGNHARRGGGLYDSGNYSVESSTIVENTASESGGGIFADLMQVRSSIVYFNTAPTAPNYAGTVNTFSCLTPLPAGTGNIDGDPAFIDPANGNFRLQTNSPCINTGGGPSSPTDLDDRPRFVGGHIDMGAYEFQGPGVGEFTDWLQQNGLPTSGSADHQDTDEDRMDNWQEWIAGTSPTNAASLLQMYSPSNSVNGITVTWQSVPGKTYFLQRGSDLAAQPAFSSIESNLVGQAGFTSFTDSTATNYNSYFYRVGVQ